MPHVSKSVTLQAAQQSSRSYEEAARLRDVAYQGLPELLRAQLDLRGTADVTAEWETKINKHDM